MAVILSGNHPKALWPGVHAWWGRKYAEHTKEYPDLFEMKRSTKSYEEDVELTGFGLAPVKAEGASTTYQAEAQGIVSRYINTAYSLGYIVTREAIDDGQYEQVSMQRSGALAFSMNQTKENVGATVYNSGFTNTGADGVSMIDASHPSLSGNQSNILAPAADLSEASLEDLSIQVMGAVNSRGLKISLMPQSLIVPRQLLFEATRILQSTLQNDTANNAINALKFTGMFPGGAKVNHYLTDTDAFFIRTNCPNGLCGFQRVDISFTKDGDFDTDNAKAKAYERYVFGYTDWRGIYGSIGA